MVLRSGGSFPAVTPAASLSRLLTVTGFGHRSSKYRRPNLATSTPIAQPHPRFLGRLAFLCDECAAPDSFIFAGRPRCGWGLSAGSIWVNATQVTPSAWDKAST